MKLTLELQDDFVETLSVEARRKKITLEQYIDSILKASQIGALMFEGAVEQYRKANRN